MYRLNETQQRIAGNAAAIAEKDLAPRAAAVDRDAAFPNRPGADRYKIGTLTASRTLEAVVAEFLEQGREIVPLPNDTWLMDAFDHVVTNVIWQAHADESAKIPFRLGPVKRRAQDPPADASGRATPMVVNYWQGLFGA